MASFKCNVCKLSFSTATALSAHQRAHFGTQAFLHLRDDEPLFEYDTDDDNDESSSATDQDKYRCDEPSCNKKFKAKRLLAGHKKNVHGKFFWCCQCGHKTMYKNKGGLRLHHQTCTVKDKTPIKVRGGGGGARGCSRQPCGGDRDRAQIERSSVGDGSAAAGGGGGGGGGVRRPHPSEDEEEEDNKESKEKRTKVDETPPPLLPHDESSLPSSQVTLDDTHDSGVWEQQPLNTPTELLFSQEDMAFFEAFFDNSNSV
jgi:hypothetical protein